MAIPRILVNSQTVDSHSDFGVDHMASFAFKRRSNGADIPPSKNFNKGEALQICSYTHRTPPVYPIDGAKSIGEITELNEILTQTFI